MHVHRTTAEHTRRSKHVFHDVILNLRLQDMFTNRFHELEFVEKLLRCPNPQFSARVSHGCGSIGPSMAALRLLCTSDSTNDVTFAHTRPYRVDTVAANDVAALSCAG